MAKTTNEKKQKSRPDRWRELRGLWNQNAKEWVQLLESLNFEQVSIAGERLKLCCPYHNDSNPSAEISLTKGYFRCYSGGCNYYEWDPLKFLSSPDQKTQKLESYTAALQLFKTHFNAKISTNLAKDYAADFAHRRRLQWIAKCAQIKLDQAWHSTNNTESSQAAVDWLKGRGIVDCAPHASVGLWPRLSDITTFIRNQGGTDEDLDQIKELFGTHFDIRYQDWVTFIYATDPNTPSAFKIRKPLTDVQVKALGDKPMFFLHEKNGPKGFFGMLNPGYKDLIAHSDYHEARVVEGEMDALTIYDQQERNGSVSAVFFALGGQGHNGVDGLASVGIEQVLIIPDDDEAAKKATGEDGGSGFVDRILTESYKSSCQIFTWPDDISHPQGGKMDPDSAVQTFGFVPTYNAFLTEGNYKYPHTWAWEQAEKRLDKLSEDDVRSQTDIAKEWARKLHNPAERSAFLKRVQSDYGDVAPSDVRRALSKDEDTAPACIARMRETLLQEYHLHYYDTSQSALSLWDSKEQTTFTVNPTRQDTVSLLTTRMPDGDLYAWARDEVGLPGYLPPIEGADAVPGKWMQVQGQLNQMLQEAVKGLAKYAPPRPTELKGQGIHLDKLRTHGYGYLISQYNMYRLEWDHTGQRLSKVTRMDGPSYKDDVFLIEPGQIDTIGDWAAPLISCEADFLSAPAWDAKETLGHVFQIINEHWRFRHQEADAMAIALYPFYGYILDCFDQKRVMFHLMGEAETGKSALLSMIAGARQLHKYTLCINAVTEMDATLAGVQSTYKGARMVVGLDELNDPHDNSHKSNAVKALYESLRGLSTQGHTRTIKGTPSGGSIHRALHIAAITASGTRIHDRMDDSRFKTFYMVKDSSVGSIQARLGKEYPDDFWPKLRHAIWYHAVHNAMAIAQQEQVIIKKYGDSDSLPIASSRFKDGLFPLAAIAEQFGWDSHEFLYNFCEARKTEEAAATFQTQGQDIFESLITIPQFPLEGEVDHRTVTIAEMLSNPSWRDNISSVSGVVYDAPTKTLAVSWYSIQGYMSRYGHQYGAANLHNTASSCRLFVDKSRAVANGSLARFRASGIHGNRFDIFDVSEYVRKTATVVGPGVKPPTTEFDVNDESDDDDDLIIFGGES